MTAPSAAYPHRHTHHVRSRYHGTTVCVGGAVGIYVIGYDGYVSIASAGDITAQGYTSAFGIMSFVNGDGAIYVSHGGDIVATSDYFYGFGILVNASGTGEVTVVGTGDVTVDARLPGGARHFDELYYAAEDTHDIEATDADDTAVIVHTSGTTGTPKGADTETSASAPRSAPSATAEHQSAQDPPVRARNPPRSR